MSYVEIAIKHSINYDEKTLAHAMRVAAYATECPLLVEEDRDYAIALAILHDLIEDTDVKLETIQIDLREGLTYLTKEKNETYVNYCKRVKGCASSGWRGRCAYIVKLADMKDHLSLKETLTDKLKAKYLEGLAVLL